ncbi:MAG TPA: LLM class flavin-dependent oxidoreductase [Sandaracinaceae bacterium LLY-WYZ-13_1]|nr:LLM class flavin-dependent oxidoreductase [Sandaracinaceae bacterium LLY-WYZ-13_1]
MTTPIRCYVMGSESLLVQCSEILLDRGHKILGVVTADDDIAAWAAERELRVVPPGKDLASRLGDTPFDWFFSIANLSLIPDDVLALPTEGAINFHDGPLPRYAGLNATTWAILHGERTHGVSWHLIEGGVDEGDVLQQRVFELGERETALTLNTRCYELGIESFSTLVDQLGEGTLERQPQDLEKRTYFGKYDRPQGASSIDWDRPAHEIDALVRALDYGPYPNPVGIPKVVLDDGVLLLPEVERAADSVSEAPGTVLSIDDDGLEVATQTGSLLFGRVLDADGRPLTPQAAFQLGVQPGATLKTAQRDRLGELDQELARHEGFWTRRLRTLTPAPLPQADRAVAEDVAPAPDRRALEVDATPARLLAGLGAWLRRTTDQEQLDLGYRDPALADRVAGAEVLYAERVPLRLRVDREASFDALLEAAEKELARVAKRGTFPRELFVRQPDARRPAWELVFERVPSLDDYALPAGVTAAVLTDGERASLAFDRRRMSERAADDLRHQLQVSMAAAARDGARPVAELPLLSDEERATILEKWNDTARDYPNDRGVHQLFEAQADATPDAAALIYRDREMTYAELDRAANRVAHRLIGLGVGPDVPVGLCTDRSLDLVVGALGVLKAGGAYVPLDPSYPAERLSFMLSDSGAEVVVTQSAKRDALPATDATLLLLDADDELSKQPEDRPTVEGFDSGKLAYVIYTSGSTGKPKGVMVEHRNVANFFAGMDERIPHDDPEKTWLAVTSLSFDISVLELFWTLARGFRVVLSSDEDRALVSGGGAGVSQYSHRKMDFSLFYFASDEGEKAADKYRLLLDGARFADENGFSAVWTPERHFHAFGGLYPNPSVASAALAVITKNVQLRAGSCVNPLHHPVRVAEEWALVDNLSNGRVGISFAAGWQPNDFILRPESFENNKQKMIDEIDVIRRLWRGETVSFEGPKGPVEVKTLPRPVQKELPFFITAAGNPKTFELAGTLGGGILTHLLGQSLEEAKEKIEVYRKAWREAGHPGEGHVVVMLHTFVGPDEETVKDTVREPMKGYLKSSMMLIQQHAWSFPAFKRHAKEDKSFKDNFLNLSPDDTDALLDHSFERYYESSGLFGTPESCLETVEACRAIGIDEIGCLIDYGIDSQTVMDHLPYLNELRAKASAPPRDVGEDDYSIAAQLTRHRVTHMQCTPSMAQMLVMNDEARRALSGLKHLMVGGEAFPGALAAQLREATEATITNMYGPTETTIWSSTERAEPAEGTVAIGTPIANTRLYVLDQGLQPVPVGVAGELYIGGDGVTRGYWDREALTEERFVPDPFAGGGARMYRTGDEVRWREDGHLEFLGRIDHQVKLRGYRIELGEIESLLDRHEAVRQAVVLAREDSPGDKRLVAYVVPAGDFDAAALRAHLRERLPDFMVPAHFVKMDRFPLTPNKKVDRKALPRPEAKASGAPVEHVAPAGEIEEKIASIWKHILGLSEVGSRDNFFELGGHSLLAVQAHREIREATGRDLTVTDIFRFPTIGALAEHLEGDGGPSASLQKSADRAAARRRAVGKRRVLRRR